METNGSAAAAQSDTECLTHSLGDLSSAKIETFREIRDVVLNDY